jgi:Large polyvalent protein associated domain 38/ParB-like nuclease domain
MARKPQAPGLSTARPVIPAPSAGLDKKLDRLLQYVPVLSAVTAYLTPDEQERLKVNSAKTLVEVLRSLPKAEEMAAVAYSGRAKRGWYRNSANAIVHIFGPEDAPRFVGLLAATSPRTKVENNLKNTLRIWKNWNGAGRPTDKRSILKIMAKSIPGNKGLKSVLPGWIGNTVRILSADDPSSVQLSGPKVNSFMHNLRGVVDEVTNDGWMAVYGGIDPNRFQGTGAGVLGKGPGYVAMNALTRKAADVVSAHTGEKWSPAEVQETVWSWVKTLYEKTTSAGQKATAAKLLKTVGLTHEEIGGTPDFATLLADGIYRQILEEGGYGRQLRDLRGTGQTDSRPAGIPSSAQGYGLAQSAFESHLRRAAARLDKVRRERNVEAGLSTAKPPLTAPSVGPVSYPAKASLEEIGYPRAKATVSGLAVRPHVPNLGSIESSSTDSTTLPGIREVPFSYFEAPPSVTEKTKNLALQIKENGEINPLIVMVDAKGPYILEGSHRYDALRILGKKSFPAVVVVDHQDGFGLSAPTSRLAAPSPGPVSLEEGFAKILANDPAISGKFIPDPSKPLGGQAQMHTLRRGDQTKREHAVIIDGRGRHLEIQGTAENVFFGPDVTKRFNDPNESIVVHHNHPDNAPEEPGYGSLSDDDLKLLGRPGVKGIWANGHQGNFNRGELTDKMRGLLDRGAENLADRITTVATIVDRVHNTLRRAVVAAMQARRVEADEINATFHQIRNQILHDAEIIDLYHNHDTAHLADYIKRAGLDEIVPRIVAALKGIFHEQVSRDRTDNRPPAALVHPGDLGTSLGVPSDITRQYRQRDIDTTRGVGPPRGEAPVAPRQGDLFEAKLGAPRRPFGGGRAREPEEEAVLNRIVPSEKSSRLPQSPREAYTAAFDDLNPIAYVTKKLAESIGTTLPADIDPYKLARLTRGSMGRGEQFLLHGTYDYETLRNNGLPLDKVLEPVKGNLDGFRAYIVAKRALELEARGVKTGVPLAEARQVVARGRNEFGPVQRELVAYQDRVLEFLRKSGIVSADGVTAMRAANRDYVPFFRMMTGEKNLGHSLGAGLKVKDPVKGIKGSERQIIDPIESIIKNTYLFIGLAERNRALRALEDLANRSAIGRDFMRRVPVKRHPIEVTAEEINRHLDREGIDEEVSDTMTIFRPNAFRPNPDEIALFRDGKRRIYNVGKEVAEAVNALDRDTINMVTRLISLPARTLRAGAVLAPEFIFRNPVRDQFSAVAFSEHGYLPVYDFVRGLGHLFKKGDVYQNWLKGGGANAAMVAIDRDYIGRNIIKLEEPSALKRVGKLVKTPIEALRMLSELFENATRLGEFNKAQSRGRSPFEGGYSAREVTLDFSRMGAQTQSVNALIAFWNAQLQGVDRAARAVKAHPFKTLLTIALSIAVPSILLWMINHDDERYKELPRWEKDYYWHIMTDNWENVTPEIAEGYPEHYTRQVGDQWQINNGTIYRIPKPFELGVLFGSVPERILDALFTNVRNPYKGIMGSIGSALLPPYLPQIMAPMIEQFANKSTFFDRPIVPGYLKDVAPKYQAQPYTSKTAKALGSLISKISESTSFASPLVIENYIRDWTGGLGMHIIQLTEGALRAAGVLAPKNDPESTLADLPVIKGFVSRFPGANSASVQDFYDTYQERKTAKSTVAFLKKTGRGELAKEELEQHATLTQEGIHKALGVQFKAIRNIYADLKMPPRDKRQIIDSIYLHMIELAKRGNANFDKTEKTYKRQEERAAVQP